MPLPHHVYAVDLIAALPESMRAALAAAPLTAAEQDRLAKVAFALASTREEVWAEILWDRFLATLAEVQPASVIGDTPFRSRSHPPQPETPMTDTRIDPTKGSIRATLSRAPKSGDKKPAFRGTLTLPGDPTERPLVLWARRAKSGDVVLTGHTRDTGSGAMATIETLIDGKKAAAGAPMHVGSGETALKLDPRDIVLFESKDKTERRPQFYGYHHTGEKGRPPLAIALWAQTDQKGVVTLSGFTKDKDVTPVAVAVPEADQDLEPTT